MNPRASKYVNSLEYIVGTFADAELADDYLSNLKVRPPAKLTRHKNGNK